MSRQNLRTRKGCNRCKIRRKKCDEVQPVCGPCSRLQLACSWPDGSAEATQQSANSDLDLETGISTNSFQGLIRRIPSSLQRATSSTGYEAFRNDTEFHLTEQAPAILTGWLSSLAEPACQDLSIIFSLALREPWVRDALCAFSASFLSKQDARLQVVALRHYQTALSALRDHFTNDLDDNRRLSLIVVMMLLGLFEAMCTRDSDHAVIHFSAALRLCSVNDQLPPNLTLSALVVYRLAMEFSLYYIAILSIFHADPCSLVPAINWEAFKSTFPHPTDPSMTNYRLSPFLGGHHDIYRMILQISCLARQLLSKQERETRVELYFADVDGFLSQLDAYYYDTPFSDPEFRQSVLNAQVYIPMIRIFLLKVLYPKYCSSHPAIRAHFQYCSLNLARLDIPQSFTKISWPLLILLCSAHTDEEFQYVNEYATKIPDFLEQGDGHRFTAVSEVVARRRSHSPCTAGEEIKNCEGTHDGLDLLLLDKGILYELNRPKVEEPSFVPYIAYYG